MYFRVSQFTLRRAIWDARVCGFALERTGNCSSVLEVDFAYRSEAISHVSRRAPAFARRHDVVEALPSGVPVLEPHKNPLTVVYVASRRT
jgi:hypothetical protein